MFLVTILHVLGHGRVLSSAQGANYNIAWLLEISAYCAVNCFGLISGFVGYDEKEKPYHFRKYFIFWLQVVLYSFGISFVSLLLDRQSVNLKELKHALFPLMFNEYWYVSCYTVLFFVIPWLNKMIRNSTKKECFMLSFILLILSIYSLFGSDSFQIKGGYSPAWLITLYITGAWIKKYDIPHRFRNSTFILTLIGCILITWLWKMYSPLLPDFFTQYTSPSITAIGICYVCFFSRVNLSKIEKFIRVFSPAAFGVYLIHEQHLIRNNLITGSFEWIASLSPWLVIPTVVGCAFGIYVICLMIDTARVYIFKLLRVTTIVDNLASKTTGWAKKIISFINEPLQGNNQRKAR